MHMPALEPIVLPPPVKLRRRKDKVRAAWIGFTGRILAQLVGACATVWLGLHFVQHGRLQTPPPAPAPVNRPLVADDRPSVVVLPFANVSGDESQAYLAEAVTDALITELTRSCGVRVVSKTTAVSYADGHAPMATLAADLGITYVVEGAVVRSGNHVRVTTQVIDARADAHVWGRTHDERVTDPIALQDRVARVAAPEVLDVVSPRTQADGRAGDDCATPRRS